MALLRMGWGVVVDRRLEGPVRFDQRGKVNIDDERNAHRLRAKATGGGGDRQSSPKRKQTKKRDQLERKQRSALVGRDTRVKARKRRIEKPHMAMQPPPRPPPPYSHARPLAPPPMPRQLQQMMQQMQKRQPKFQPERPHPAGHARGRGRHSGGHGRGAYRPQREYAVSQVPPRKRGASDDMRDASRFFLPSFLLDPWAALGRRDDCERRAGTLKNSGSAHVQQADVARGRPAPHEDAGSGRGRVLFQPSFLEYPWIKAVP